MNPVLMVFTRAPVPGACKTRLIPALGAAGAAALHANLTRHALGAATAWRDAAAGARVELRCAGALDDPFFLDCARSFGVPCVAQGGGDLGARMWRALAGALARGELPLLVGADCPWLAPAVLDALCSALAGHDAAFVPATDGGYVAVGIARAVPELFAGVPWGGPRVMAATRERARRHRVTLWAGEALPDIDVPGDLGRLRGDPRLAALLPVPG